MIVERRSLVNRPGFQLAVALGGAFAIPALLAGIIVIWPGINIHTASAWFFEHDALQVYFEFAVFGMIPLLFVILCKDNLKQYGIQREGLARGVMLSMAFVVAYHITMCLVDGECFSHPSLEFSLGTLGRIWHMLIGIFAYGPLELFFLIWMIVKVDQITGREDQVFSLGLLIVSIAFGMYHIITSGSFTNAVIVTIIYLSLNVIFKYARNGIGPMLGWTLINSQVLAYIALLWG